MREHSDIGSDRLPIRESSTESLIDISGVRNTTDLLISRLREAPEHTAFETRTPGAAITEAWKPITTSEFMEQVTGVARGLIATGVRPGDRVLIVAPTQYAWAIADCAAMFAGAVVVPAYDTASPAQLAAVVEDARPTAAFAGDRTIASRITAAAERCGSPLSVWVLGDDGDDATTMLALRARGRGVADAVLEQHRVAATLDDVATIVYTSGTTATPKGARITHRNLVGQVLNTAAAYREVVSESGNTILFLPLTHVLGRALQLICIANGMRIAHLSDPKEVVQALAILRPTFLVVVPRVLEKIQTAAAASAREKGVSSLWASAVATAEQWGAALETRDRCADARTPIRLRLRHALYERVFFRRLRAVMGGRIDYLLSGAATLPPALARFFRGIGVPVIEGYGLTETTAPLTGGRPGALIAGSVGPPLPGNTVRIAENGEVLARGVGVFAGYQNPADTERAFVDGFFRTGDLGSLDSDGRLTLRGRLTHVITTSTGRTVSPEKWERTVEAHPLVAHAVLIGTDRPYLTGIVVADSEAMGAERGADADRPTHVLGSGIALCTDQIALDAIDAVIESANRAVSPSEQAQYWRVVVFDDQHDAEFVTPTMKLKRGALLDALDPLIDTLYR